MTLEELRAFFGWCTLLNWGVLILWFLFLLCGRDWVFRIHGKMFGLEPSELGAIHYKCIVFYKTGVMLFNLAPYLALRIIA